jgi:hypothetical protein
MDFLIPVDCPVDKRVIWMSGEEAWGRELYRSLAQFYQISIVDITKMLILAVTNAKKEEQAEHEFTDRIREAERDAALLKLALPIEEAIEILLRAREGLWWLADNCPDPVRREEIEELIAEREAGMDALRERLEQRNARIAEAKRKRIA